MDSVIIGIDPGQKSGGVAWIRVCDGQPTSRGSMACVARGRQWPDWQEIAYEIFKVTGAEADGVEVQVHIYYEYTGRFARVVFGAGMYVAAVLWGVDSSVPLAQRRAQCHELSSTRWPRILVDAGVVSSSPPRQDKKGWSWSEATRLWGWAPETHDEAEARLIAEAGLVLERQRRQHARSRRNSKAA